MSSCTSPMVGRRQVLLSLSALIAVSASIGDSLSGKDLLAALRGGGYVILMRHANSPRDPPDPTVRSRRSEFADGEALILHPDGQGGAQVIARVKIEDWPHLADSH